MIPPSSVRALVGIETYLNSHKKCLYRSFRDLRVIPVKLRFSAAGMMHLGSG